MEKNQKDIVLQVLENMIKASMDSEAYKEAAKKVVKKDKSNKPEKKISFVIKGGGERPSTEEELKYLKK